MMKEAGLAVRPSAHEYGDPGPIATIE